MPPKVRQCLAWLAGAELDGDPLDAADGRDWAVRDYRAHLQAVLRRKPATVNSALAAVDDFYIRRGLGATSAKRAEIPDAAPRAPDHGARAPAQREDRHSRKAPSAVLVAFRTGGLIGSNGDGRARRSR